MRIQWDNELDKYSLIFSSERSGFPAANVQHPFLIKIWRSLALNEWIVPDVPFGETITANCAFIAAHNLTAGATIRIQANDTNDWGAPDLDESFTWDPGNMGMFFIVTTKRFWRFRFIDASNPAGYIQIGRLSLGSYLQMPPVQPGPSIPTMTSTRRSVTPSGQAYGDKGAMYLTPAFNFPLITQAERISIEAMWQVVEHVHPVFLVIWEESLTVQRPIYCRIDQDKLDWKQAEEAGLSWSIDIAFMEAK